MMWLDVGAIVVLLGGSLLHSPNGGTAGAIFDVALLVPLLWRRRAPVPVFCLMWAVAAVQGLVVRPTAADAALLLAFYTVASSADSRVTIVVGLVLEVGVLAASIKWTTGTEQFLKVFVGLSGLATAAGVLGVNVRNRRQTVDGLRERAQRLEGDRERDVALARATERGRIAREMHDVIAHNLSVMVALCDGAGYHVYDAPERVEAALDQASRTGREALAEMRQLLGVLRESREPADLAPLPGISQIESLVELIRAAGVPVSYAQSGDAHGIAPGMELAIYRIVQEALTNTLKHAGPGASAWVTLTCRPDVITVDVRDDGRSNAPIGNGGAGLRGMSERATVYGGVLAAGPAPEGGWRVTASLALEAAPVTTVQ
jgi:signal transduction histidine kinase